MLVKHLVKARKDLIVSHCCFQKGQVDDFVEFA